MIMGYLKKQLEITRKTPTAVTHRALLDLTERIVERMESLNINRAELARRSGLAAAQITRVLSCEHNVTFQTLGRILTALEADLAFEVRPWDSVAMAARGSRTLRPERSAEGRIALSRGNGIAGTASRSAPKPAKRKRSPNA